MPCLLFCSFFRDTWFDVLHIKFRQFGRKGAVDFVSVPYLLFYATYLFPPILFRIGFLFWLSYSFSFIIYVDIRRNTVERRENTTKEARSPMK